MGAYKIRRNTSSDRWLIWLDGGDSCADPLGCEARQHAPRCELALVATDVTFAGGSAGGEGVLVLADDVGMMLPAWVKYQALIDGAMPPKFNRFDATCAASWPPRQ